MTREREVKVVVLGEDKGGSKALHSVEQAAGKLGPTGDAAEKAMGMLGSTLSTHLGPAGGIVEKGLRGLPDLFRQSTGEGLNMSSMLKGALVGGAVAAGAALIAFAGSAAQEFVGLAGEIRTFQRASGASAEESSRFVAVLDDLGISSDTGANAIFKLAKNAGTGADKLREVGIEVAHNRDGTANLTETLLNAADAYSRTNDPAKRAEIAFAAFGKQGKDLIPILEQGRAGLQSFFDGAEKGHQIFSQGDLDQARRYELAIDDLQDSMRGLQLRAGPAAVQIITEVSQALADGVTWLDEHSHKGSLLGEVFSNVWKNLSEGPPLLRAHKEANKEAGDSAAVAAAKFAQQAEVLEFAGGEVSDLERETGQLTEENKKAIAAAEKYKQKIEDMAGSVQFAMLTMGRATDSLSDDQRDLALRFDESKSAADQLKQGLDILVGVHLTAAAASIRWQGAIAETTQKLAENKATLDITTAAGRDNQSAIIDMVQAGLSHVDALQREGASSEAVTAAYGDHVAALRNVMHQAGYTDAQIEDLLRQYNLLAGAPDITKNIRLNTYETTYINTYYGEEVRSGPGGRQTAYALGMEMGPIPGSRNEVRPILAHGGEWVVTPEQMANLTSGASGGAYMGGGGMALGSGGMALGPGSIIVYALDPKSAAMGVRDELLSYRRRVPELGL